MVLTRRRLLYGVPSALATPSRADSAPVRIYAAMTLRPALDRVLEAYRDAGSVAVAVYAPTPVLLLLLAGGAPADILLTADPLWMNEAARQELIQPNTRQNLMANDLVLAGPIGTPTAGAITAAFRIEALLGGGRLAMGDPGRDPAARYAKQSLQALGLWQRVEPHIAMAESSLAAVVLLDHREVRAAICFVTDLYRDDNVVVAGAFPADTHAPIVYPAALVREVSDPRAAEALKFLRSVEAQRIFYSFGYTPAH